jgi:hypothetical protein
LCEGAPDFFSVAKWQKLGEGKKNKKNKTEKTLTWSICLVETANLTARHRTNVACELDSGAKFDAQNVDCELASERTSTANFEGGKGGREEGIGGQSTFVDDHAGSGYENAIRSTTRITTGGFVSCLSQVT